ncbi:hypothetical protein B0H10DRAFT_2000212, partial [Mycena sp. CBHHK59/15]
MLFTSTITVARYIITAIFHTLVFRFAQKRAHDDDNGDADELPQAKRARKETNDEADYVDLVSSQVYSIYSAMSLFCFFTQPVARSLLGPKRRIDAPRRGHPHLVLVGLSLQSSRLLTPPVPPQRPLMERTAKRCVIVGSTHRHGNVLPKSVGTTSQPSKVNHLF